MIASKSRIKYLGIIPARSGSKRIPGKNVVEFLGKPLIAHTIETALSSRLERVVVSTDDDKIALIAKAFGAEVPVLRPARFAEDCSPVTEALLHMVEHFESAGEIVENVVLLQPTSPFRTAVHIDECIELFESSAADTLSTVYYAREHPYYTWTVEESYMVPFFTMEEQVLPRQKLPVALVENGAIYIVKRSVLKSGSIYGENIVPYVMSFEDSVDIDTPDDILLAEFINSKRFK